MEYLRAEYNRRAQLRPLFWVNTMQLPLEKVYTRLKFVSRQTGGNQGETDVFGMIKENKNGMTIVEGCPGIGKTTFCLKLAYDWANQRGSAASFPELELLLLLKCRDIDGDLKEAITEQLFPKDMSQDVREELFRFFEGIENPKRVLIILDGLDELAEKSKHHVDDLLYRKRWAFCNVLATTRQEKGIEVRKEPEFGYHIFLQIKGFTKEDAFEYIRRHFKIAGPEHSSKGEKLIKEIEQNALLQDLLTNPLNLLLLCVFYEDDKGELPSSRTDLYHEIIVCVLRRYCAKHNVEASKKDRELETQFETDIRCLGKLAWNCLLNDRHSFFEEELEEFESRNKKLLARELGFVYKEESLKRWKPQHEYCFLHKSFQEYLAASYIAHTLRRNKFNVFEHLNFDAVVKKFPLVFLFVCGILREEASILFAQIGEQLKGDWDWLKCSRTAVDFFIESWSESGNAEGMANTFCSFMPFPRVVHLLCHYDVRVNRYSHWNLLEVLMFCRSFSKVEAPDEIHLLEMDFFNWISLKARDLASLPNLKSLDFSCLDLDSVLELFQSLSDFASLTELALPRVFGMSDWGFVAEALPTSKTLQTVGFTLVGESQQGWARALDAGLCANTPLSSVNLRILGLMSETALQALENLLLNKSLSSVSVIVEGDMPDSLAVTLARCVTGQTAVKSLELRVNGKLSFCCANLIERGIVDNNSLSKLVFSVRGERPDNWQAIVENLNGRLAEKSTVNFAITPNTLKQVTATQLRDFRPYVINYGFFKQENVTVNVWGELTVDGAEALYNVLPCTWVCPLTLNIHGKLTVDFLHCTARHVDKQKPLCPITINTWEQLTNEGKALFKELEIDKNPAITLNVCEVHIPSDESGDNKIVSIDNPASLIALLASAEETGKENLTVTINGESDDWTFHDREDSTGRKVSQCLRFARNYSLKSLTLTINNFGLESIGMSDSLIGCLKGCISLKSLTLTVNEYSFIDQASASLLSKGLGCNTSLISVTLTVNIYSGVLVGSRGRHDDICDFVPNTSINSFTLSINDFFRSGIWELGSHVLWSNYKSLTTLKLTLNNCDELIGHNLPIFLDAVIKGNSLRTLRLNVIDSRFTSGFHGYDFSKLVVKSPSLELIELTISRYGVVGSSLETLKWEKQ